MKTNLKDQPLKTAKPESQAPDQVRSISQVSIEQAIKNSDRKIYTVVITGGPCAGKTTALSSLRKKLSEEGFHVIELAETATSILNANIHPWESPAFQKAVFSIQKCWEDTMIDQAGYIENPKCILLCDRGLMDGKAYCSGNDFEKIAAEFSLDEKSILRRYDQIIHLVSAANGAEKYYSADTNGERMENLQEARIIEERTRKAWSNHPNRVIIDNSTGMEEKVEQAWQALKTGLTKSGLLHSSDSPSARE